MRGRAGASRGRARPDHAYVSMLRVVYGLIKHRTTAICGRPWALKRSTFHPDPFRLVSTRPFQARARARNRVGFRKSGACPLPGRPRPRGYSPKAPKAQWALRGRLAQKSIMVPENAFACAPSAFSCLPQEDEKKESRNEEPGRSESNKQPCCLKCAGVACPTATLPAAASSGLAA